MPHRLDALFQHTHDAVIVADADGRIVERNPAADARFGHPGPAGHLRDLFDDPAEGVAVLAEAGVLGPVCRRTVRLRGGGEGVLTCVALGDGAGGACLQVIVHATLTSGHPARGAHDPLTGLPGRAALVGRAQWALAARDDGGPPRVALLHVDLNRLQRVNESLGRAAGDAILRAAARRLEAGLPAGGVAARGDGDDFLILLDGVAGEDEVAEVAGRLRRALAAGYEVAGHEVFCGSDVGAALAAPGERDPEPLLRAAEAAMSRARQTGQVQLFRAVMHAETAAALRLDADLRRALERGELRVFYQPVVGLDDGRVHGFEALVRWMHPERGLVTPAEFIPLAEETGLIVPIGSWVLERAVEQLRDWHRRFPGRPPLSMGVNLSTLQLGPALVEEVDALLRRTRVAPETLKLEVTESVVMGSAESILGVLDGLKALGVRLQVDDFGTGYSSLSYLHRLPVDILKIDRSFIVAMDEGSRHRAIVRAIVALAEALGLETTAEGVDDPRQARHLREMRCTCGQGYLWSRPVPAAEAEALITAPPRVDGLPAV